MAAIFEKDPNATLDYTIDWTTWLSGDTIATSSWTTHSALTASSPTFTQTTTRILIAGGTPGLTYKVRNNITTAAGLVEQETFDLQIKDH